MYRLLLNFFFTASYPGVIIEQIPGKLARYRDSQGRSIVHIAFLQGDMHLLEYLAKSGFDLGSRDNSGETIIDYAQRIGRARL